MYRQLDKAVSFHCHLTKQLVFTVSDLSKCLEK